MDQTPAPLTSGTVIGRPIDRVDARAKVTGQARYTADQTPPRGGLAYAAIVTSTIPRGRISAIDTAAAERAAGVLAVLTHLNAPALRPVPAYLPGGRGGGTASEMRAPLSDDRVHYDGQAVALVVADTLERALGAAELVRPRYVAEPHETDMRSAAVRARVTKPEQSILGRPADLVRGDPESALARSAVRVDATFETPQEHHNQIEPHATTAIWHGPRTDRRLTVFDATQHLFGARRALATAFGLPEESVRVLCEYVGGAFGGKGTLWPHMLLAAMGARAARRPVKLVLTRPQMFAMVGHRPQTEQRVVLGADARGRLTAIVHEGVSSMSRERLGEFVEPFTANTHILYACPNLRTSQRIARLDRGLPTFMRAPGESVGSFALESAMDELALALSIDPIELRLRNYAERDPEGDHPWSSNALRDCFRLGAERIGWERRAAPASTRDGRYLVGLGMATAAYPSARLGPASARVRLFADAGSPGGVAARIESGTHDVGQGTYTAMTQIGAEALGLAPDQVLFELGDSRMPRAAVSGGATTVSSVGTAIVRACEAVRADLVRLLALDRQSPLHGLSAEAIGFGEGHLFAKADLSRRQSYASLFERVGETSIEKVGSLRFDEIDVWGEKPPEALTVTGGPSASGQKEKRGQHSFGAQFAQVQVDRDTGEVRVSRFVGVFDCGRIVNPKLARSQMIGGITWGIGQALTEETVTDHRYGRYVNANLGEYHVAVNADVPAIDVSFVGAPDRFTNPMGAKTVGEIPIVGVAAAIANAVFNATGKRVRSLPITPDKVIR